MSNIQRVLNKPSTLQPEKVMKLWRHKPKIFFRDVMDVELDGWQEDCVDLYINNQRLALVASKGPGKTFLLAMLGWHFFITGNQPKIAALSVTKDHLMSNLWAELLKWRKKAKLLENSTNDGFSKITLKGHEGYSFIDARSYPKSADETQQASALAGLHADFVGFLIDEAGTIPDAVLATADAALSTGDSPTKKAKLLVTANPEEPRGTIYRAYMGQSKQKWAVYTISGDPEDPKRAPRVDINWAKEQIDVYGRDDPWVMVNVLAKYPNVSSTMLLTELEIKDAMERSIEDKAVSMHQKRMGVDVSRGGVDSSCLVIRQGQKVTSIDMVPSTVYGPELAGIVALKCQDQNIERVYVDDTGGYGSSVVDSLRMFPSIDMKGIKYNSKAQDPRRYFNKRTEMWVRMRDWVKNGGSLPKDPRLAEELMMPKLIFHGGIFRLEEKEQIKARLGRSPDRADALAQTFSDIEQPSFFADYSGANSESRAILETYRMASQGKHYADDSDVDKYYMPTPNYKA